MKVLGIETSCDETAAAIVDNGTTLISSVIASSMDLHAQYGGIVPEIAARSHIEAINPVIEQAISNAKTDWDQIDAIAVTSGPGLLGSLLIGVLAARTLAIAKNKPLYGVNHIEAHVYANFLSKPAPKFPFLALIVSGGHTQLVHFKDHFNYQVLGQTFDDAVGEAFDKAAKIIGLPYPGGPNISRAATKGNPQAYPLPTAKVAGDYNFSFSGLKTATLRLGQQLAGGDFTMPSTSIPALLNDHQRQDIAASFQDTAIKTLVSKTLKAYKSLKPAAVVIAGGVAANQELRDQLKTALPINITYAPMELCTDNAAMIAALGCFKAASPTPPSNPYTLAADPNLKM